MSLKEKIIRNLKEKELTANMLRSVLHIKGSKAKVTFLSALKELECEKALTIDENGYYHCREDKKEKRGVVHISKTGHGRIFLESESGKEKYLIEEEDLNGALDGDEVLFIHEKKEIESGYFKAQITKILERKTGKAIFEFDGNNLKPYSTFGNIKVLCSKESLKNLVSGSLVLVSLGNNPVAKFNKKLVFEAEIEQIIGHKDDPDADVKAIGASHGFPLDISEEAKKELEQIKDYITEEDIKEREDLREKTIFTIDGSHTKDMDDAVSIDINEKGNFILGVYIADVSTIVKKGSHLDIEARERGTSAYLADSVIPMFPHKISNGICSLNEGEDRLAKATEMEIDSNGNVINYRLYDCIIKSKKKMTYEDVNDILMREKKIEGYEPFEEDLQLMFLLSEILQQNRKEKGDIDFSIPELDVIREEDEFTFKKSEREVAEKIIENFMILANVTVTKHFARQNLPFVYRVHEDPNTDRLTMILLNLMHEGICGKEVTTLIKRIERKQLTSRDLDDFLSKYKGTEIEEIVSTAILTSMSKARYSDENLGHYGLAQDYYTHSTSPIRRYPDLIVQRLIDQYRKDENNKPSEDELSELCSHSSYMERQADIAEKESLELKMAEYSIENIGKEFRGHIIAFNPYGLDIKLDNEIKGIARYQDMKGKPNARLGQKVHVLIKEVSIPHRAIYFSLVNPEKNKGIAIKKLK